jgi:hypothetical protein
MCSSERVVSSDADGVRGVEPLAHLRRRKSAVSRLWSRHRHTSPNHPSAPLRALGSHLPAQRAQCAGGVQLASIVGADLLRAKMEPP